MRLTALKYGETVLSEHLILQGGERGKLYPISLILYLIETEDRKLLVDAGCDTMPGFPLSGFCGPVAVLERYGVSPGEITDVILTHHHHDHAEGAIHFPTARFWIQQAELEKCKRFLPDDATVQIFEEEASPCRGVRILRSGGHTVGSSVVELIADRKRFVICGDEIYHRMCVERGIPTGASCCPERSRAFLETYGGGDVRLLLAHDGTILPGQNGYLTIL